MIKGELSALPSFLQSAQVCRLRSPECICVNIHSDRTQVHILEGMLATPMSQPCPLSFCIAHANLFFATDGEALYHCASCLLAPAVSRGAMGVVLSPCCAWQN